MANSTLSINTVSSSSEQEIEQLWNSIRLQLKKQIFKRLEDPSLDCADAKFGLLKGLVFLYPAEQAWQMYKGHRSQEINKVLSNSLNLENAEAGKQLKIIKEHFPQVNCTLKDMMLADFKIMISRVFQDLNIPTALKLLYSSSISNYIIANLNQAPEAIDTRNVNGIVNITENDIVSLFVLASELKSFDSAMEEVLNQLNWSSKSRHKKNSKNQPKGVLKVSREVRMSRLGLGSSPLLSDSIPQPFGATEISSDITSLQKIGQWRKEICSSLEEELVSIIPVAIQRVTPNHETTFHAPFKGKLVCDELYGWHSFPRYISAHYEDFFKLINEVACIVSATNTLHDVFILSVRSSFDDILVQVYKAKSYESSDLASGGVHALGFATYCAGVLLKLHQTLYDGKESSSLLSLREQFVEVVDELSNKLIAYHVAAISTMVLHEAESNNYTNQHAFYEDERCSFSIQMYHLHIESIKHDWSIWLPSNLMQKMVMKVVEQSLCKLGYRFSLVKPSYKRVKQLRFDITTLLLIAYNNMFMLCDTVSEALGQAEYNSSCLSLLRVLAVVTSPLDELCKAFQDGLQQKSQEFPAIPTWLQSIYPDLFPFDIKNFSSLPDKAAVYFIVSLLSGQPNVNLSLTLQALTTRGALLAKILCKNLDDLNEQASCVGLGCSGMKCLCSMMQPQNSILMPVTRVLAACVEQPQCLADVLVPIVIERGSIGNLPGKREEVPAWLLCIKQLFKSHINRLIVDSVKDIVELQNAKTPKANSMASLKQLPCGCPLAKEQKMKWKDEDDILRSAARTLLSRLSQIILCFSTPLCLVFQRLQDEVKQKKQSKNAVAFEVLCWCVWNTLRTEEFEASNKSALVTLKHASELTMEVLSIEADENDNSTHPLSSEWLKNLIIMTTSHCSQDHLANVNRLSLADAPLVYQERYYMNMVIDIATDKQGAKDLIFLNRLTRRNLEWIEEQLGVTSIILPRQKHTRFQGHIISENMTPTTFDPIQEVNKLGRWHFDHNTFIEYPWNWSGILNGNLGLTLLTFRNLFLNRFELLENEPLNDDEMKFVEILKETFELDSDLV